jgi:hypothetical protein
MNIENQPKIEKFRVSRTKDKKSKTLMETNLERILTHMKKFDQYDFLQKREHSLVTFDDQSSYSTLSVAADEDAFGEKTENEAPKSSLVKSKTGI